MLDPFRRKALERLSSPEELDRLVHVTRPRTWIALGGLLLVIVAVVLWAALTTITTTCPGSASCSPREGWGTLGGIRPVLLRELPRRGRGGHRPTAARVALLAGSEQAHDPG